MTLSRRDPVRIATRASPLARWQATWVATALRRAHPGLCTRLVPLVSAGDRDLERPLEALGSTGVFVTEIQQAVLAGHADMAVHSLKDLPTAPSDDLVIAAVPRRADPVDLLILQAISPDPLPDPESALPGLPLHCLVGTSSRRRQVQLAALRPDLVFAPIRGNVQTRLDQVARGRVGATVMAAAGLRRLGLSAVAAALRLDPYRTCTPAPAQGALAVECRREDRRTRHLLQVLEDGSSLRAVSIERDVLAGLRGGCNLPLGCLARPQGGAWRLMVALGIGDGSVVRLDLTGPSGGLAGRALEGLSAQGAASIRG